MITTWEDEDSAYYADDLADYQESAAEFRCQSCGKRGGHSATWMDRTEVCVACALPEFDAEIHGVRMPLEEVECPCCMRPFPAWGLVDVLQGDRWCLECALMVSHALMIRGPVRTLRVA